PIRRRTADYRETLRRSLEAALRRAAKRGEIGRRGIASQVEGLAAKVLPLHLLLAAPPPEDEKRKLTPDAPANAPSRAGPPGPHAVGSSRMPREDIEALRNFFAELNRLLRAGESIDELADRYVDPECVAELGRMEGTFTGGPEGFLHYFEGQRAVVDGMQIDP